jgi:mannosidase alpha-like ER degradation enhancer 2
LIGELDQAKKSLYNYHQVWKQFGFVPEFYDIPNAKLNNKRDGYPLRPEFIESVFYLYRATRDPHLLQIGADVVEAIYSSTRTECGFATVKSVYDHTIEDRMESFFLAETLKYLYLLFDETNFVNNDGSKGVIIDRKGSHCVVDSGGYVFNTEAHLIDIAAVYCCSHQKNFEDNILSEFQNNLDLYSLFGLHSKSKSSDLLQGIRAKYSSQISNELDISCDNENNSENNNTIDGQIKSNPISQIILESEYFSENQSKEVFEDLNTDQTSVELEEEKEVIDSDITLLMPSKIEKPIESDSSSERPSNLNEFKIDTSFSTLESSISRVNIPNVEKTESQDFNIESDVDFNIESDIDFNSDTTLESDKTISISLDTSDPTIMVEGSSILAPEVIQPTHSVEGWHTKSVDDHFSDEVLSILSANTLVSDKLSKQIVQVLLDSTNGEHQTNLFINSSTLSIINTALNNSSLNYELLLCPSQPFLLRLSYFGQMIVF